MTRLLRWLLWMFLAQQVYNSIEKYPEIWTDPRFWATVVVALLVLGAVQFKVLGSNLEAKYSGENANLKSRIDLLEQQLKAKDEEVKVLIVDKEENSNKPRFYLDIMRGLGSADIQVLEEVERFERGKSSEPNKIPSGCNRETLMNRLGLAWSELEAIIDNLKRLKLVESMYMPPNAFQSMPIKLYDDKPLVLTAMGREFLKIHSST